MRILMVHGRAQGGRDPKALEQEWREGLDQGLNLAGLKLPRGTKLDFPYYGDELDRQVDRLSTNSPRANSMGVDDQGKVDRLVAKAIEEIAIKEGVTDRAIRDEMDTNVGEMGPQNWAWVQAIVRVLDSKWTGLSSLTIEIFLRDVFLYITSRQMRQVINKIVFSEWTSEPTVVVAHSLGSVVCYDILRQPNEFDVAGFITLGSPLGINAVSGTLGKPRFVAGSRDWYNGFDQRDIVALNPLDDQYFPTDPAIINNNRLVNDTRNRHGISGYLDDAIVAARIVDMLERKSS